MLGAGKTLLSSWDLQPGLRKFHLTHAQEIMWIPGRGFFFLQSNTVSMSHSFENRLHYVNVLFMSPKIGGWWYRGSHWPSSLSSHVAGLKGNMLYTKEGFEREPSLPCFRLLDRSFMFSQLCTFYVKWRSVPCLFQKAIIIFRWENSQEILREILELYKWKFLVHRPRMELAYLFRILGTSSN